MLTPKQKKFVESIPGDEWWKTSSQEAYERAYEKLLSVGMDDDSIESLLSGLYWSAADCFGG